MPISLPSSLMVSVSGFRGTVGDVLTPELIAALAGAFGAFLKEDGAGDTVVLGRDSRTSGALFVSAAQAGLQSVGMHVIDLGVVPTPTLMLAVRDRGAAGGLGVTASHNPAQWNALKFAGGDGTFLDGERMGRFQAFLRDREIPRAAWDSLGSVERDEGAIDRHLDRILALPYLDVPRLRERAFHVALDCVHGAGGRMVPKLLEALGCRVDAIGLEADGFFPRDPEPTAANLADLSSLVRSSGAELGFAVDPDVDRLSLVDGSGTPLGEDLTLALCAVVVLRRRPGVVVTNLSTSQVVADVAGTFAMPCYRTPVGEIHVTRRIQAEGAVIGGEGNGGIILPELNATRDAPLGIALILQHLLDKQGSLAAAAAQWPSYVIVKEKVAYPRESLSEGLRALASFLEIEEGRPAVDWTDGVRLTWDWARAWIHVRPSGTEPVVRFIAEAPDRALAEQLVLDARTILEDVRVGV